MTVKDTLATIQSDIYNKDYNNAIRTIGSLSQADLCGLRDIARYRALSATNVADFVDSIIDANHVKG